MQPQIYIINLSGETTKQISRIPSSRSVRALMLAGPERTSKPHTNAHALATCVQRTLICWLVCVYLRMSSLYRQVKLLFALDLCHKFVRTPPPQKLCRIGSVYLQHGKHQWNQSNCNVCCKWWLNSIFKFSLSKHIFWSSKCMLLVKNVTNTR